MVENESNMPDDEKESRTASAEYVNVRPVDWLPYISMQALAYALDGKVVKAGDHVTLPFFSAMNNSIERRTIKPELEIVSFEPNVESVCLGRQTRFLILQKDSLEVDHFYDEDEEEKKKADAERANYNYIRSDEDLENRIVKILKSNQQKGFRQNELEMLLILSIGNGKSPSVFIAFRNLQQVLERMTKEGKIKKKMEQLYYGA